MRRIQNKLNLSLHVFRLMTEQKKGQSNEKYIEEQSKLLECIGIDKNFNSKYTNEIRGKCHTLGEHGWVICPFWTPEADEKWYDTWFTMVCNDTSEEISDYFIKNEYSLLTYIIAYTRIEVKRYDWLNEAEKLFYNKHYIGCAMVLTAIFEQSIRKCPIDEWRKKVSCFYDDAIKKKVEDFYKDSSIEPLSRYIETVLIIPSIDGFIDKYFNNGKFESKNNISNKTQFNESNEPLYLERNWLMHGLTQRKITETDCIKLFNVICSLHYVLHTVFQTDYRQ